jgi:hypothetical protein
MMEMDTDPSWITGWFLDHPTIESISRYDIFDFLCWAMFDGRNQEHLTTQELQDLEGFVEDLEYRISIHLYGVMEDVTEASTTPVSTQQNKSLTENDDDDYNNNYYNNTMEKGNDVTENGNEDDSVMTGGGRRDRLDSDVAITAGAGSISERQGETDDNLEMFSTPTNRRYVRQVSDGEESTEYSGSGDWSSVSLKRPRPKKLFRFSIDIQREEPNYFSNLYESYKERYERYKTMVENADFHPVQDIRNKIAETAQQAAKTAHSVEESAMKSAQNMYESIIQPGSEMDKQLSALSHATSIHLSEAWNSVKGMKERLETANFLSEQRKTTTQQLRANLAMLSRMREMSYAVNSSEAAAVMRRITECYEALGRTEVRAREAFLSATGKLTDNSLFSYQEPKRYARYSSDPLMGIKPYPLGFHLLILGFTEIPLRVLLGGRGFERRTVGPVTYYYHPGKEPLSNYTDRVEVYGLPPRAPPKKIPNVFVHGIGVGLLVYLPLIDALLETGHPLLLPEIPYVSAFRPWQSTNSVLSPAVVASTVSSFVVLLRVPLKTCFMLFSNSLCRLCFQIFS